MAIKLVADVAVVARDHVLFVRYRDTSKYDGEAGWFLPDAFLQRLEHPDDAARRILGEQVGLGLTNVRLAEIESFDGDAWHLVFHYLAAIDEPVEVVPGANVAEAKWCPLGELPDPAETAHHGWALDVLSRIVAAPAEG